MVVLTPRTTTKKPAPSTKAAPADGEPTESAVVVYDPETGAVRHVHREIVMPGGRATPPARLAQRALQLARGAGGDPKARLDTLQVKPSLLRPDERLRVERGRLVRTKDARPAAPGRAPRRGR